MKSSILISQVFLTLSLYCIFVSSSSKTDQLRATNLPSCRACRILVESFKKGLTRTEKGKFEGGDTAWEEEKLGSYARSEIRLVEIQENLCKDVEEGRNQCFTLAELNDGLLEDWWFKHQIETPDLYNWLCIQNLKRCCPENHFGPDCAPCPGYPDKVCNKNGKCKGAGSRKGNGVCVCDAGYQGENCSDCADAYYVSYKDDNKLLCSKCHMSCAGPCNGPGNKGCKLCQNGWLMDTERGCLDVNECAFETPPCKKSQFCVNTEGSFKCLDCDRSCAGCSGDGPDMCNVCAPGYTFINNMCVDTSQQQRSTYVNFTRYLTYIGLCIATCIILQRNVIVAALVGVAVALYISVSEYMLNSTSANPDNIIDPDSILKSIS